MPFPDEVWSGTVVGYRDSWSGEFFELAQELRRLELAGQGAIDHIGSTSVPGLVAKDVIDIQVRVPSIDDRRMTTAFERIGYRRRSESWNNIEATRTGDVAKLVFAPPVDARSCNVHVRTDGTTGARNALLFRDCLRHDDGLRQSWGRFKVVLAESLTPGDLLTYGQVKQSAWLVLMHAADAWALGAEWEPEPISDWVF